MPDRIDPKRVPPLRIEDFAVRDQGVLVTATRAWMKMVVVGFKGDTPFVVSVGHPDGLSGAEARPQGLRAYSLTRIRGLSEAADEEDFHPVAQRR